MQYRPARQEDLPALVALWQRVFGDDEAIIKACLATFAGPGNVYLAEDGTGLAAMLLAVPCHIEGYQGVYLYALATAPEKRGAGVMSRLMAYAEEVVRPNANFAALIPASASLFGFYEQRGYAESVLLRHLEFALAPPAGGMAARADAVDAGGLVTLREAYVKVPCLAFGMARMDMVADDLNDAGALLCRSSSAYAIYVQKGDVLLVPELGAKDDAAAQKLLDEIGAAAGKSRALITVPQNSGLFAGKGATRPAALVKWLAGAPKVKDIYLRFALDVIEDSFTIWNVAEDACE